MKIKPSLRLTQDKPSPEEYYAILGIKESALNLCKQEAAAKSKNNGQRSIRIDPLHHDRMTAAMLFLPQHAFVNSLAKNIRDDDSIPQEMKESILEFFKKGKVTVYINNNAIELITDKNVGEKAAKLFVDFATRHNLPEDQIALIRDKANALIPTWQRYADLMDRVNIDTFVKDWATGTFKYTTPIFEREGDADIFFNVVAININQFAKSFGAPAAAMGKLKERILAHEDELHALIEERIREEEKKAQYKRQQEEEKTAKAREAEQAQRQKDQEMQEKAQADREAFLATPQPYKMLREDEPFLTALEKSRKANNSVSEHAAFALDVITTSLAALNDIRPEPDKQDQPYGPVKELGDILLNGVYLKALAKACGAESAVKDIVIRPHASLKSNTNTVRRLYRQSQMAADRIETLLESQEGTLLLSAVMLKPERMDEYAKFLLNNHKPSAEINKRIREVEMAYHMTIYAEEDRSYMRQHPEKFPDIDIQRFDKEISALNCQLHEAETRALQRGKEAHDKILDEIHEVLGGKRRKEVAASDLPEVDLSLVNEIKLPAKWREMMAERFDVRPAHEKEVNGNGKGHVNKHVEIFHKEHPDLYFDIKFNADDSAFMKEMLLLNLKATWLITHIEINGFIKRPGEHGTELYHPEYDLTIPMHLSLADETRRVNNVDQQFRAKSFHQRIVLQDAVDAGITVSGIDKDGYADGPITITHPDLKKAIHAQRGYLTREQSETIEALSKKLHQQLEAENSRQAFIDVADHKPTAEEKKPIVNWKPDADTTLLLFDASTLNKLAIPRNGSGRSWLDLIKYTARLPNIKVIVPAVVAEWEMQGQIGTYDPHTGKRDGVQQIDFRYTNHSHKLGYLGSAAERFFSSASHARLNKDGTVDLTPGDNPNIIIMETTADQELYDFIRKIEKLPSEQRKAERQKHIDGQGAGENAIERIVKRAKLPNPMIVVTDDMRYVNNPTTSHTSLMGAPVGHASTGTYLWSELRAREPEIRHHMHNKHSDTPPERITLPNLDREIFSFWERLDPGSGSHIFDYSDNGKASQRSPFMPKHIDGVIKDGIRERDEVLMDDGESKSNGKWSDRLPSSNRIHERRINPQEVHINRGNGHSLGATD